MHPHKPNPAAHTALQSGTSFLNPNPPAANGAETQTRIPVSMLTLRKAMDMLNEDSDRISGLSAPGPNANANANTGVVYHL
jgi:hypothetical protein